MDLFKTYFVPFDFSDTAADALDFAARLAERTGGELVLAHGLQLASPRAHPEIGLENLMLDLEPHLEKRLAEILTNRGLEGRVIIKRGMPDAWLSQEAEKSPGPLVVMSRHGWSGKRKGLGGHAKRIMQASTVPVWLTGGAETDITLIAVAVDLDEQTERILGVAKGLAAGGRVSVRLIHIRDPRMETGYLSEIGWPPAVNVFDDLRKSAEDALSRYASQLRSGGVNVEAVVLSGPVATRIIDDAESHGAELLVSGKHAKGVLETLLLGSTARGLAKHWPRHLLLVP